MSGSQSGRRRSGADGAPGVGSVIRRTAEPLVVGGLAAHGSAVGLTAFSTPPPLLTALVATLAFAGISLAYGRPTSALVGPSPGRLAETVVADAVVLVSVGAGGWLMAARPRLGRLSSCRPCAPVDRSVLRVLLGAPLPRGELDRDVPRATHCQRDPRCPRPARGRAGRARGGQVDLWRGPSRRGRVGPRSARRPPAGVYARLDDSRRSDTSRRLVRVAPLQHSKQTISTGSDGRRGLPILPSIAKSRLHRR